jgi:hypothetical protein
MVNWEAVTAIGTVFTGMVILITVLVGHGQLRATIDQLQQLRRASQLDAANVIFAELSSPTFLDARRFILNDLPERLKDPKFRKELELVGRADENVHKELIVLRTFERIGLYVDQDLLNADLIRYLASGRVVDTWEGLTEVVAVHRRAFAPHIWEYFEKLYRDILDIAVQRGLDRARQIEVLQELRGSPEDAPNRPS